MYTNIELYTGFCFCRCNLSILGAFVQRIPLNVASHGDINYLILSFFVFRFVGRGIFLLILRLRFVLPAFVCIKRRVAEQFALHLGCMVYAVARSKEHLGEDYEPDLDGEFKPNMINSVVFLVQAVQQV